VSTSGGASLVLNWFKVAARQNADGAFHGELSYAAFAGFGDRDRNFLFARRSFSGVAEDKRDQIVFRRTNPSNCKLQSEEGVLLGWDLAERIVGSEFERSRGEERPASVPRLHSG